MYSSYELREIIERNMEMIDFSNEASDVLLCAFNHVIKKEEEFLLFSSSVEKYSDDKNTDINTILIDIKSMADRLYIHEYTMYMLLFLAMADAMRSHYDKAGIDRKTFVTTLCDLKYQLDICFDLHGVWGHCAATWQIGFLRHTTLGFGRLQFQYTTMGVNCVVDGYHLKPDSPAIFVHIPRTGTRLDHSEVVSSYKAAAEYFAPIFSGAPLVFACNSWLLYPKNFDFVSAKSNLRIFYEDFSIINVEEYPDYKETWRLFDTLYTGNPDELPADTSLRRAYIDMMKRGEKTGRALGAFVYKG